MPQSIAKRKRRRAPSGRVVHITVDTAAAEPLFKQVYAEIREAILSGRMPAGMKLPSTRVLATDLAVSRSTIVLAYEQLRAETYIESRVGAGTIVSNVLPEARTRSPRVLPRSRAPTPPRRVAKRVASLVSAMVQMQPQLRSARAFRVAVPATDVFPIDQWSKVVSRCLRRMPPRQLSYGDTLGLVALRKAVADYLIAARGVRCSADQVMIVSGTQQAFDLCAKVLLDDASDVWLEDPGYFGVRGAMQLAGARIVPVPVDAEGIDVAYGRTHAPDARAAFVTPSRQLPLGVTMSLPRRLALLDWAARAGSWIIEDDYDSEFRYASRPIGALQGLDASGCVLYTGTFSKVMFPALRLGYLVVPEGMRDAFAAARHFSDFHNPYLEQAAMAEFIGEGHFEQHIRRMRAVYRERQRTLVASCGAELGGRLHAPAMDAGMSLIGWLQPGDDDAAIAAAARDAGIDIVPVSACAIEHATPPGLILGFSGIRESDIRAGVHTLAAVLARYDRRSGLPRTG